MSEQRGKSENGSSDLRRDAISLDEVEMVAGLETAPTGGGKNDTMMQAAEAFEQQLEQMSAWKHQLSQQMELLRRDGIKLLERQKNLALERRKLAHERDAIEKDKAHGQKIKEEAATERQRLDAQVLAMEKATEGLLALQGEKEKWLGDLAQAREATEKLSTRRATMETEIAALEARAAEYRKLEAQRDALLTQIHDARATLDELSAAAGEVEQQRRALEMRVGELGRQQEEVAERERRALAQETMARDAAEQLEAQRRTLLEGQTRLTHERDQLETQIREHTAWLADARQQIETEQVAGKQQVAAAEARLQELAAAQTQLDADRQALDNHASELTAQELQVASREREAQELLELARTQGAGLADAQNELVAHQAKLAAAEAALATQRQQAETELQARQAALAEAESHFKAEAAVWTTARQETQKALDEREAAIAEELEHVAKQTRRLNERRAQIDAEATRLEAIVQARVEEATAALKSQAQVGEEAIAGAVAEYQARCASLELRLKEAETRADGIALESKAGVEALAASTRERDALTLELESVKARATELSTELSALRDKRAAREAELAARAKRADDGAGASEAALAEERAARAALAEQVNMLGAEVAAWREKYEAAAAISALATGDAEETQHLQATIAQAQSQLDQAQAQMEALATELTESRQVQQQTKNELAQAISRHEQDITALREAAERQVADALREAAAMQPTIPARQAELRSTGDDTGTRVRLLRQARGLRAYRRQMQERKSSLEASREETARQREQLRQRKENLEQVKRLLEKQEMVMARKLADHSAIKTVAAVGIFVIMILGGAFTAVYQFAGVTYAGEATLYVKTPPTTTMGDRDWSAWLGKEAEKIRQPEVTSAAWKNLRSDEERYGGHATREEWLASLDKHMAVRVDPASRSILVEYEGPSAEGSAQVSTALAKAFVASRVSGGVQQGGEFEVSKAHKADTPKHDGRFMTALLTVAGLLAFSLVGVVGARFYIGRQLREIDRMADEADLEDIKGDLPLDAKGTPATT